MAGAAAGAKGTGRRFRASTPLLPPGTSVRLDLRNLTVGQRRSDLALGYFSLAVAVLMYAFAASCLAMGVLPAAAQTALFGLNAPITGVSRALVAGLGVVIGLVAKILRPRLMNTLAWARLPQNGSLFVGSAGVVIRNPSVLDTDLRVGWNAVRVITLDSGLKHDRKNHWRRFPLPAARNALRTYLFDTEGDARHDLVLLASRPTPPNVAVLFRTPQLVTNPNSDLIDIAFAPSAERGMPVRPPSGTQTVNGVLLSVSDLRIARRVLLASNRVRALRQSDY